VSPEHFEKCIRDTGLTHLLNSVSEEEMLYQFNRSLEPSTFARERVELHRGYLVNGDATFLGGTVSYVGNHDKGTLTYRLRNEKNGDPRRLRFINNPDRLTIQEKLQLTDRVKKLSNDGLAAVF
jgi:hypothetical protein